MERSGDRCQRYYGVTFGTKVRLARNTISASGKEKAKADNQRQEVKHLDSEIGSKELILEWRKQAVTEAEAVIDKIDAEYQEKIAAIQQLDSVISEKENKKIQTEAELAEKKAILNESAHKVFKLDFIDKMETGKTVFGGKVTISPDDYDKLTDLAKKQIAAESHERELTAENADLKEKNAALAAENNELQGEVRTARSLRNSLSALQRELDGWKQRYKKVIEFIENLGLKDKLEHFLHPMTHMRKR